jgi:hypothetical protein
VTALRPEVPSSLESVVHRLLEKDPARRHDDAVGLIAELEALRADMTSSPRPRPRA